MRKLNTDMVSVRIPEEMNKEVKELARVHQTTSSEVIRYALNNLIDNK